MDARNGGVPNLDAHIQHARAQEAAQQQLQMALQVTMNDPQELITRKISAIGIREEPGRLGSLTPQKVLMIATPDGTRRDYPLSEAVINVLKQALLGELAA